MEIKLGSQGEDVKKIQEKLKIEIDGDFGPMTEASVKKWQSENGLKPDGVVGKITWSKMFPSPLNESKTSTSSFNISPLKGVIPDKVYGEIPSIIEKFKMNTPLRLSHFLSQCAHESGNFNFVVENLNHSAKTLASTWPTRFSVNPKQKPLVPNALAEEIQRKPQVIGNKVYSNRMGNGPEESNDGFNYRGRGYIQLTGKDNYKDFDKFVDENILENPNLVSEKYPLLSAAWFFNKNNINKISDEGSSDEIVTKVTKKVNGGTIHLDDRIKKFKQFYKILS
jgi:putative chitinase